MLSEADTSESILGFQDARLPEGTYQSLPEDSHPSNPSQAIATPAPAGVAPRSGFRPNVIAGLGAGSSPGLGPGTVPTAAS